jgi:hypothetical protein
LENDDDRYELWLDYLAEHKHLSGDTFNYDVENTTPDIKDMAEKFNEKAKEFLVEVKEVKKKRVYSENENDDDDEELEEDGDGNIIRTDEDLLLDELEPIAVAGGLVLEHHSCSFFPERWFYQPML